MASSASAFVSLDKYKSDMVTYLAQLEYSRKKFARIDSVLNSVISILDHFPNGDEFLRALDMLKELRTVERLDIAGVPVAPSLDNQKFSSIADGVQASFEFEGER